jgi:AraC-like DNA-binding protein
MSRRVVPSAVDSRESRASARPSRRVSFQESPPSAALAEPIHRVLHCAEPRLIPAVRRLDPGATLLTAWPDFADAYPQADVNVLFCDGPVGPDLPARLDELTWRHRLPSLIVVTHVDAEHLLPFRRIPIDEFVPLSTMARDLPPAVLRSVIDPLRERLALHLERLEGGAPELRSALARVLRDPAKGATIGQLAVAAAVTPRTLENQWKAVRGDMRLQDLVWMIRLLAVLELRARGGAAGTPLGRICDDLRIDVRTLQRACRRHLGSSLGRVAAAVATSELLRLRRRTLEILRGVAGGPR